MCTGSHLKNLCTGERFAVFSLEGQRPILDVRCQGVKLVMSLGSYFVTLSFPREEEPERERCIFDVSCQLFPRANVLLFCTMLQQCQSGDLSSLCQRVEGFTSRRCRSSVLCMCLVSTSLVSLQRVWPGIFHVLIPDPTNAFMIISVTLVIPERK